MALYQLIYTSSAQPLSGSPGFGVRTVTEGTPKEIISLVEKTSSLRDYNSGKFSLGNYAEVMSSTPERVFEYPRTYYYRVLTTADGKRYTVWPTITGSGRYVVKNLNNFVIMPEVTAK